MACWERVCVTNNWCLFWFHCYPRVCHILFWQSTSQNFYCMRTFPSVICWFSPFCSNIETNLGFTCYSRDILLSKPNPLRITLGVDFAKLFCQAKWHQRTAFGKKFAVQFHQHCPSKLQCQIWQIFDLKFFQPFAVRHWSKTASNFLSEKAAQKCWWNQPLASVMAKKKITNL